MVLKNVEDIEDHLNSKFFNFFLFLLQKMENNNDKITIKKARITTAVKHFKEKKALHSHESTERELKLLKKAIKFHEDLANDKDQDDVDYLINRLIYFENLFHSFLIKYNIDQTLKEPTINNSTFIKTPEWLALKRSVLNPYNNNNKCFQYSVILSLYHEQFGRNYCRISNI